MTAATQEAWRAVTVYPYQDDYEVSDLGRVRRVTDGAGKARAGHILRGRTAASGHKRVALCPPFKNFMVHRLVLEAFVGPCPVGMEGCHNDCDPSNNRLENLRWDTRSSNQLDRHKTVGWVNHTGEKNGRARLTSAEVQGIRLDARPHDEIAAQFGVSPSTISALRLRKTWRDVA